MNESTAVAETIYEGEAVALEPTRPVAPVALRTQLTPAALREEIEKQKEMRSIMKDYVQSQMVENHHYYYMSRVTNPTAEIKAGEKPALMQDGAYMIMSLYRCIPGSVRNDIIRHEDGHVTVVSEAPIYNADGHLIATGNGSCSTRESKYAYRKGERVCPDCGVGAIIKGKDFSGKGGPTGWVCFAKKGGCGAKFSDGDARIEEQQIGRIDNPDIADIENTVLKMSVKRATVAAVRKLPLVSDLFSTDPNDGAGNNTNPPAPKNQSSRSTGQRSNAPEPSNEPDVPSSVQSAVSLSTKLQKEFGVPADDLAAQFLPEGVKLFSKLSEEQAAEIIPGLSSLLNAKITEGRRG